MLERCSIHVVDMFGNSLMFDGKVLDKCLALFQQVIVGLPSQITHSPLNGRVSLHLHICAVGDNFFIFPSFLNLSVFM